MINLTNSDIINIAVGNISIEKAYIGSTLVWEKNVPIVQDINGNSYYIRNYINISKSDGRYCSLGLYPNETDYYETKMHIPNNSRNYPFGGWSGNNSNMYGLELYSSGIRFAYDTGTIIYSSGAYGNKTFTFKTYYDTSDSKMYFYVYNESGSLLWSSSTAKRSGTASKEMYIGTFNGSSYGSITGTKAYYFKFWRNQTLVRDMIPVQSVDTGEYGFFDKVNLKIYYSSGSSSFTGG